MSEDYEERDPLPCWIGKDEAGTPVINGQLLRYDLFTRSSFAWQDTDPAILLAYLEAAHRWILDGKLADMPGKPKLAAVK